MIQYEEFHKGDFLIFASIASVHQLIEADTLVALYDCERLPGVYERHPGIKVPEESRTDISRDGYLGLLYAAATLQDKKVMDRVIKAIIIRGGKIGRVGAWDYTNMLPLLPLFLAARYGKWVPTLPVLTHRLFKGTTGYRAHLMALTVMIELIIGKKRWSHRSTMRQLVRDNPKNEWFWLLSEACGAKAKRKDVPFYDVPDYGEAWTEWGSCPNLVMKKLIRHARLLL